MALYPGMHIAELETVALARSSQPDTYNIVQRSEAYEALAISQFFGGLCVECIKNFDHAMKIKKVNTYDRSFSRMFVLVSISLTPLSLSCISFPLFLLTEWNCSLSTWRIAIG